MGATRVPARVMARVPSAEREGVVRWWQGLAKATRAELVLMWSPRWCQARHLLERRVGGGWAWHTLEVEPYGARDQRADRDDEAVARRQAFGYWAERPPKPVVMHICRRHAAARACLERGRVPSGFACPLGRSACPMERLRRVAGVPGALELRGDVACGEAARVVPGRAWAVLVERSVAHGGAA